MRRKRLQHVADNLCQIFCGWRQIFSKRGLVELGSGVLKLDVLHEQSSFDGAAAEALPILAELRAWMVKDLAEHRIPLDEIDQAEVEARLTFSTIEWTERQSNEQWFLPNGREVRTVPCTVARCSAPVWCAAVRPCIAARLETLRNGPSVGPLPNPLMQSTNAGTAMLLS